ncbi:MAG: cell division protein FtsQ/DivIB [Chromatiales bacterium]|jgi:cell division protein FtsQ
MKRKPPRSRLERLWDFLQLWGLGLMLVSGTMLAVTWGLQQLRDPQVLPVRVVGIEGEMRFLERERLEQAVIQAVKGSFFSVDLDRIRTEVADLPWVDGVTVRRVWPDTLRVRVLEQQPLAHWGKEALLNQRGEIFRPQPLPAFPQLAVLEGEAEDALSISREFQRIDTLLQTVGLEMSRVKVDARQAWQLHTRDGLEINLGRKQILPRLARFVRLYPQLEQSQARLKRVDLRYTNGFSASWEAMPELQSNRSDPEDTGPGNRLAGI